MQNLYFCRFFKFHLKEDIMEPESPEAVDETAVPEANQAVVDVPAEVQAENTTAGDTGADNTVSENSTESLETSEVPEAVANQEEEQKEEEVAPAEAIATEEQEDSEDNESVIEDDEEFDAKVDALGNQIEEVREKIDELESLEEELEAIQASLEDQQKKLAEVTSNWSTTATVLEEVNSKIRELQAAFERTFSKLQAHGIGVEEQPSLNSIEQILETLDDQLTDLDEQEENLKEELQEKLKGSYLEDPYETGLDPLFVGDDSTVSADSDDEDLEEEEDEINVEEISPAGGSLPVKPSEQKLTPTEEEPKVAAVAEDQPAQKYKLMPDRPPKVGTLKVGFIGLHFLGQPRPSVTPLKNIANKCRKAYGNISSGDIIFETEAKVIDVNYVKSRKNLRKAERSAKKQMGYKNLYAICNYKTKGTSTGAGNTAHVIGLNTRDYYHELGHCRPWVWAHAGRYRMKVVGKGRHKRKVRVYEAYGDGTSFMGRFPCSVVNLPQAYDAGFLNGQVALHERGDGEIVYPFRTLYSKHKDGYFQGVSIPGSDFGSESDLFVGTATKKDETFFAFYLRNPGKGHSGSAMDGRFTQHGEYGGFDFDVVELPGNAGMGLKVKHRLVG